MNHDPATFHEKKGMVDYATIDHRGNIKIVAIMNFLQNAASEHAARMGASGFDLAEKDLGWVIHRYHIRINGTAPWQTPLSIKTFRFPHRNLYEMRQMTLSTPNNTERSTLPLAQATVCWVMISKKSGKPVRLGKFMSPTLCAPLSFLTLHQNSKAIGYEIKYPHNNDSASSLTSDEALPPSPDNEKAFYHFPDIDPVKRVDFELPFKVRMHDLDLNGHVNNAIFVEWAVETVPKEILASFTPIVIDVLFQKEALYGDAIRSQTQIVSSPPHIPNNGHVRPPDTTKHERTRTADCELFHINGLAKPSCTTKYESRHLITRNHDHTVLAKLAIQWQETTQREQDQPSPPNQ